MHTPDQTIVIPGLAKLFLTQALRLNDEATLGDMLAEITRLQQAADANSRKPKRTRYERVHTGDADDRPGD